MERGCHFATILSALTALGYRVEWRLLNAAHFGLAQNRQRVVIVGSQADETPGTSFLVPAADFEKVSYAELDMIHEPKQWWSLDKHGERFSTWGMASGEAFFSLDLVEFSEAKAPATLKDVLERTVPAQFDFTETMQR